MYIGTIYFPPTLVETETNTNFYTTVRTPNEYLDNTQAMQHVDEYYDVKRHRHADVYEPPILP